MTEKELRGLSRADLLELLIAETKKNQTLTEQLAEVTAKLESKELTINSAGSIAEAALRLNGIFDAAQAASAQYLENIQNLSRRQEEVCAEMERQTRQQCDQMVAQAQQASKLYWDEISRKLEAYYKEHPGLKQQLAASE